jgi:hypothetical protein
MKHPTMFVLVGEQIHARRLGHALAELFLILGIHGINVYIC